MEAFLQVSIHNTSDVPPGSNLFSFCLSQGLSGFQVLLSTEAIGRSQPDPYLYSLAHFADSLVPPLYLYKSG